MSTEQIILDLFDAGAIKFGDFVLKSGKISPYYVDLRILPSHPDLLTKIGKAMAQLMVNSRIDIVCGVPAAGMAIADSISFNTGIPASYARKEPIIYHDICKKLDTMLVEGKFKSNEEFGVKKAIEVIDSFRGMKEHGIGKYVEGDFSDGDRVALIDDLITTAESKLEALELLKLEAKRRNIHIEIDKVYVVLDREQGGDEALGAKGVQLFSLFTIRKVAKVLLDLRKIDEKAYSAVISYTQEDRKSSGLKENASTNA